MKSSEDNGPEVADTPTEAASTPLQQGPVGTSPARMRFDVRLQAARLLVFVVIIAAWHYASLNLIRPLYAATPAETFRRLFELVLTEPVFWENVFVTMREAGAGWVLGVTLGLIVGVTFGRWERAAKVFSPYLVYANATPKIALAPILILWLGLGETSKIALSTVIVFFIVQVPTQAAVQLVDDDLQTVATVMGANEWQRFSKVTLPGILPSVFGAARLAAVYALLGAVLGEFIAARRGLGQQLLAASNLFDMATAFALILVLAGIALGLNGLIGLAERRLLRWRAPSSAVIASL